MSFNGVNSFLPDGRQEEKKAEQEGRREESREGLTLLSLLVRSKAYSQAPPHGKPVHAYKAKPWFTGRAQAT